MKRIIVVADWAGDSYANEEIRTTIVGFAKDPEKVRVSFVASTPSTIHTGYILDQMTRTVDRYGIPDETVIFQNTDPRMQTDEAVEEARGAEFTIVRLKSGIYLCGPNAGYDFSFIKGAIDELYVYRGFDKGSQFRSRDLYSRVVAHLADYMEDELDLDEISLSEIPDLERDAAYVGHIDNYGNIKTSLTAEHMKGLAEYGDKVSIELNGVKKTCVYVNNMFGAEPGSIVIFPGSSGQPDNPYLEISVWRHFDTDKGETGARVFNNAHPGQRIECKKG